MGEISNSIRQILRTPLRSGLFLVLISLSATLLTLGVVLYRMGDQNMRRLEEVFMTIGLVSQPADSYETGKIWDAENKEYYEYSTAIYDEYIKPEALLFEGADYIQPPVHRPYYGAYDPSFTYLRLRIFR